MAYTIEADRFINDLDRVVKVRQQVADYLAKMAETLNHAESSGIESSGQFGLTRDIEDITIASKNLREGVFRLLVLGDMKRGKSTFLNALIGENLLPSDVNPCTAVLTVLRYGPDKQVTVHFNDGRSPEKYDFQTFKRLYTIDPAEAKQLEEAKKEAFPGVDYAVVEYPLALLEKGIEIVDSPGLNDTEARNELSLGYINNCHAILFVMRASQPCTLGERRYLENYIKGRGLTVFFLINAWDQIKESLIDPDDATELQEAEGRLHQVFHSNLAEYCVVDGHDVYDERVFPISAITALRRRLKNPPLPLDGTGFPEFMGALNTFLTKERAIAELRQARTLAQQTNNRVQEAVKRRIPLLDQDIDQLKQRISSVEPEFTKLSDIRDQFKDEIRGVRDRRSRSIADSFRTYVLKLEGTFETDFLRYQPDINFMDFLNQGKREEFNAALQRAFEQYVNDKFFDWNLTAEHQLNDAFAQLSRSAAEYGASYARVTDQMTEKLTGQRLETRPGTTADTNASPSWANWAMGLVSMASGNIAGIALAGVGFDWKSILFNLITTVSLGAIFAAVLGPIAIPLVSLGIGVFQADHARKEMVKGIKKELMQHLPRIAQEQWAPIHTAVQECFDAYEREVIKRINEDIQARKAELENLLQQKESREIDRGAELSRLHNLESDISNQHQGVETAYRNLLSAIS